MPMYAEVKRAVQDMSVDKYAIGEQNKELAKARHHRDMNWGLHSYPATNSISHLSGTS